MSDQNIRFHGFLIRPVFEDEFNRRVEESGSKGQLLSGTSVTHAHEIRKRFPDEDIIFLYDRQGGRKFYGELLLEMFPGSGYWIEDESNSLSSYQLLKDGRTCRHRFVVKGDDRHLPISLAAMCSKYIRELYMKAFNAFWQNHLPDLKPTAGYYVDAQRFLEDTEEKRAELGIEDNLLIRSR
jgi:hypothetical protein